MKNSRYFRHDWGARNDPKLLRLVRVKGAEAKAIYWDLVEMLYEEGGKLPIEVVYDVAFINHVNQETARYVVMDSGLFSYDETHFWSERQQRDEQKIKELSDMRKQSGKAGGIAKSYQTGSKSVPNTYQNGSKSVANAKQTGSKTVAINDINKINNINTNASSNEESLSPTPAELDGGPKPEILSNKHCQQVVDFWNRSINATAAQLSEVKILSDKRKSKIRTRWKEFSKLGDPVEVCRTIIKKACASKFMQGDNPRGWKASFDWIFDTEKNWAKVYEGNYDNKEEPHQPQTLDDMYREQIKKMREKYGTDESYTDIPEMQ